MGVLNGILSGVTGVMGLFSGIKGMYDSARAARAQKQAVAQAKAIEQGWYNRNYYANYLDDSVSQAALKRAEESMKRHNEEARGLAAVTGATPEQRIAQQEQNREMMENTLTNLAANSDSRRQTIDAQHQNNLSALRQQQLQQLQMDEQGAANLGNMGLGLIGSALQGVNWGREEV